jgi:hypothetical protein
MNSICDKVIQSLQQAESHNSSVMVKPEVILWPDPENQWESVITVLQKRLPQLLIYGEYDPDKKQGPAIWLKRIISNLDDGVRLNIRPFMEADVLRKNPNIKWGVDRGKNPPGSPWGEIRDNDKHLSLAEKRAAREILK